MGGRGAASAGSAFLPPDVLEKLPYNIASYDDKVGGAIYPFLERTKRAWRILSQPAGVLDDPHPAHTYGLNQPTLRWVNGSQVNDLYIDGMDSDQFLQKSGLQLDLHKGSFVLSKRISRLMRPHFVSGFFDPDAVTVAYMEQTADEANVWDGAGVISRKMLRKFAFDDATGMTPAKREKLEAELRHAQRVEFTIMTEKGQDKGHAVVADNLRDGDGNRVDFLLPQDTKKEVRLNGKEGSGSVNPPQTFVGINFVHGHNDMRLDIQSLINLYPFFKEEQLLDWLHDEGDLFTASIENGTVGEAMARIDKHTTIDEVQSWPLREYLASGGHPLWFRSHVKGLMNQHLKRLNHSTIEKMRLPIPGGRHYVMPEAVGKRAGMAVDIPRGHIHIDDKRGTAWVNDDDWLSLPDSLKDEGIGSILGGADHDDALWLHPFTDHDGQKQVLAWRSPNQVGEYVVLKPTENANPLAWSTVNDEAVASLEAAASPKAIAYPKADSRQLPPRVDFTETAYLGLVDTEAAGAIGKGEAYSIGVMDGAIDQAVANAGALGMYCNALMLNKALYGKLPEDPPAPLEDIIDSAVKTGADLSQVTAWNYANSREILESGTPIPALLHQRLSIDWADKENRPPRPRFSGVADSEAHWLDRLEGGIKFHIQAMEGKRDELAAQAKPPQEVLDAGVADPEAVALGAGLNKAYVVALQMGRKQKRENVPEYAKQAVEDYLAHFPPERRGAILLGALASVYGKDEGGSDTAVWLGVSKEGELQHGSVLALAGIGLHSVGHYTVEALRRIGVLDELVETSEGLVVYPKEMELVR